MNDLTQKHALRGQWVKLDHPIMIDDNIRVAQSQGIALNPQSGIFVFNNAARTNATGGGKTMAIMGEICDMANHQFGHYFMARYQAQYGITLVTDGTTLNRIREEYGDEELPFPLLGKEN